MSLQTSRNKTLKKVHDISGQLLGDMFRRNATPSTIPVPNQDALIRFLDQDAGNAYQRQWHRLERGLRLNRLRKFSEEEAERLHLSEAEQQSLYALLLKSLDRKLLNSKTAVIYDQEQERITEIKGLVMHRNSEGTVLFQLLDKQKGVTFRRKKPAVVEES
jgi:hypothetical protein